MIVDHKDNEDMIAKAFVKVLKLKKENTHLAIKFQCFTS